MAFTADLLASALDDQKFINKYESKPIPSQPKKNCIKFEDNTNTNIKNVNKDK
jgi:hypothetical protein